jgi:signal transduction histidine kinase
VTSLIARAPTRLDNLSVSYRISDAVAVLIVGASLAAGVFNLVRGGFDTSSLAQVVLAASMLAVGAWWLTRQAPGTPFREMAIPAAVATVTPLLVGAGLPPGAPGEIGLQPIPWLLAPAAAATVGLRLADAVPASNRSGMLMLVTAGLAVAAALVGMLGQLIGFRDRFPLELLAMMLIASATVVPGLLAAVLRHTASATASRERENVIVALELAVLGLTPGIAVITVWGAGGHPTTAGPLIVWILVVLAAQFFAVRPLANRAMVATTQRDAVVAAMEAERSRIASDIHDDALQELTMLGWRLDAAGDREGAATAREVADRLRAILGDLRLPILDDLGAGPALEWLVDRVERLTGADLTLERSDPVRPPPEIELAFFRVAQEAIANAVRHGRPPVTVRYWTSESAASLAVDDAGPGVDGLAAPAGRKGFGLLNMAQRAEQIGALLNVRSWPAGGTRVTLEWRA